MLPTNQHARHQRANNKRKVDRRRDAVHPRPPGPQGTRDERVKRRDGQRDDGVEDAVGRRGLVLVLVQAAAVQDRRASGGIARDAGADADAAWACGFGDVDCEGGCILGMVC